MKKKLFVFLCIILFVCGLSAIVLGITKITRNVDISKYVKKEWFKRETKDERYKRDFELFTQRECPKFVDPCTRLDSACYDIGSRTLTYFYTVQDILDDDSIYTEDLVSTFHDNIQKELKGSIQMKGYKDEGITFRYLYHSITTGKMMLEMTFTKEDYGQ